MGLKPTFADVRAARERTRSLVLETPLLEFDDLNARAGRRVLVKVETMQRTGAFKFRGATAKLTSLTAEERIAGVVAYSTGNHGMAIAEAARLLGISATIVAPIDTPAVKVERMIESGAEIVRCDRFKENGEQIGRDLAEHRNAVFVHPFDDAIVIAGQGTLAIEMIAQAEARDAPMDVLLVNSAGGGFVAGCAVAVQALAPNTRVWSVECTAWDAIRRSLASGRREDNLAAAPSVCDAIQARAPGETGHAIFSRLLDRAIAVDDDAALDAVRYAFDRLRLVVEPGGAVGLAAVLKGIIPADIGTIGIVLCGANVDVEAYRGWLVVR